jgi:hypothetical protein
MFYEELMRAHDPVGDARVLLGRTPHLQAHYIDFRPMKTRREGEPEPDSHNGYQTVLAVGHLAMYVIAWVGPKPPIGRVWDRFGSALVQLWPAAEAAVVWPPSAEITLSEGLDELAETVAPGPAGGTPSERESAS